MKDEITKQLLDAVARLRQGKLFGQEGDTCSMRVPAAERMLWLRPADRAPHWSPLSDAEGESAMHALVYQARADAGAVLLSTTDCSTALANIGQVPATLFDEQARHIGRIPVPVPEGDLDGLLEAVRTGSNAVLVGTRCLRIGMTRDRLVFNAELFEKCATAFVIARSSGRPIKTIPDWVRYIAGRRLRRDQRRAAERYARGQIPQGMNAYD